MTDNHQSDVDLVHGVRMRSAAALERFLERMRCIPRILTAKNARLGHPFDPDEVHDLAQETFARVWSRIDSFEGTGSLEAWVYRFCCHVMMNAMHGRRHVTITGGAGDLDLAADRGSEPPLAEREALREALLALEPDEAEVVQLKHLEGLTFAGIALRTRTSPSSAKTRYYRGLRKLRQILSPLFRGEAS